MKSFLSLLAIFSLSTESVWAETRVSNGNGQIVVITTTTTVPPSVTTTTLKGAASIKDAAVKAQANAKKAKNYTLVAMGVAAAGVGIACLTIIPKPDCPWWIAGALAAGAIMGTMLSTKGNADNVYNSVAVADGLCPTCTTTGIADPNSTGYDEYGLEKDSSDPATRRIQATLADLKRKGISIDPANGKFKTADGKEHFLKDYLNADGSLKSPPSGTAGRGAPAMPTSGAGSLSDFNALNSNLKSAMTAAADGLESGSAFDDNISAGGKTGSSGTSGAAAADGALYSDGANFGGGETSAVGEQGLPEESVQGLARKFGDSNIGVATDTLWVLIQRRYKKIKDSGGAIATTVTGK